MVLTRNPAVVKLSDYSTHTGMWTRLFELIRHHIVCLYSTQPENEHCCCAVSVAYNTIYKRDVIVVVRVGISYRHVTVQVCYNHEKCATLCERDHTVLLGMVIGIFINFTDFLPTNVKTSV